MKKIFATCLLFACRVTRILDHPQTHRLPIPALELLRALNRQAREGSGIGMYVLPGDRKETHFTGIQKPWQRIRVIAGLDDLRIHDLRHVYASTAVSGGESLYMVGNILGHQQSATTQRYAHLALDPILEVANRTAGRIASLLNQEPAGTAHT